ncbi:hypothetical protein RhiirA5_413062 [Rhizophagus irregularis]|uniref:RNase H type-1 domain-containing protein n=1 Tax=Rhizophagus irregularis TaxID=588596 RepID=A0A2N0PXB6_9GLOM|nr:hypothetical protein RhiirA5_413062 [Rhizophagus irregularis]
MMLSMERVNEVNCISVTYREHFIPHISTEDQLHQNIPWSCTPILKPCKGCPLHIPYYRDQRPLCVTVTATHQLYKIDIHGNLRANAFNIFTINSNSNRPAVAHTTDPIISLADETPALSSQRINFYTDGAFRPPGSGNPNPSYGNTTTTNMGFGWVHKNDTNSDLDISFFGGTSLSPSSSKAEAYAILMVVPPDSVVKIYTDSMNCVHTFQRVDDPLVSMRKILKIPNHDVWRLIKNLTGKKNLACLLFKVKAHSGDLYNDLADLEAVADDTHPVYLIIHSVVPQSLIDLIHSHTHKSSHTSSIVMNVMKLIHLNFSTHVWRRHKESMVTWEKRTGIYAKKIKLRRAKRRANNKRTKRIVRAQTTLPSLHRTNTPPFCFGVRNQQDRYDDRYRITYLQPQRPNDHFVPRWISSLHLIIYMRVVGLHLFRTVITDNLFLFY